MLQEAYGLHEGSARLLADVVHRLVGEEKVRALLLLQVVVRDVVRRISRRDIDGSHRLLLQLLLHIHVLKVGVRVRSLVQCFVVAH